VGLPEEIADRVRRAVGQALALLIAGLIALVAAAFLVAALFLALNSEFGPLYASLATAGVLLILAALVLAVALPRRPTPSRPADSEAARLAISGGVALAAATKAWFAKHRVEALAGAFALGFALGFSRRLRRALGQWLKG
jgi:hypothetical protein